jgi:hypothetical protein
VSSPDASELISITGGVEIALGESSGDPGRALGIDFLREIEQPSIKTYFEIRFVLLQAAA